MGMGRIAATGMQAAMSDMDVLSNNIANASTCGYKQSRANFSDIYPSQNGAGNAIGMGVNLSSISQNFAPGKAIQDGIPSHMAIGKGNAFFVIKDSTTGAINYSRDGKFEFDPNTGYFMLGKTQNKLQGFSAVNDEIPPGSSATDLFIDTQPIPAVPTTIVTQHGVNLSSNAKLPTSATFDEKDTNSYTLKSPATIFDTLGNKNDLELYYVKTSTANTWNVYASVNGTVVNSSPAVLTFNSDGSLNSSTGLTGLSFNLTNGATSPQSFDVSMLGATQSAQDNDAGKFTWDGSQAGKFTTYEIDKSGMVNVVYDNGTRKLVAQVALAAFSIPQNLQYIGNSIWSETSASGSPTISSNTSKDAINVGSYEDSNVDMAGQLVGLITAQNTFQANAQVEQVYNQVMQTITKL